MAHNTKRTAAAQIALTAAQSGQKAYTRLQGGVRTHGLIFRIRGTVTLAGGPATALRNAGSLWSIIDAVGMEDNGKDVCRIDGMTARALSQMVAARSLTAQRINGYANAAYTLEESIYIPFAWPLAVSPVESVYVEPDPRNALQAFVVHNANASTFVSTKLATTPGTATVSGVTVDVIQVYDTDKDRPLFLPFYRQIQEVVAGTATEFPFYIKTDNLLRGMIIGQDTSGVGNVDDIISAIAVRSDGRDIIGPSLANWETLVRQCEQEYGGDLGSFGYDASAAATQPTLSTVYLPILFQQSGRLSNVLNPAADRNLRAVLSVAQSGVAAAGTSLVKATLFELLELPGVTKPGEARGFNV